MSDTGLHSEDIRKLLIVLQKLVDQGNTVVIIEHNLDVAKVADYIIDLGPEGGDKGGEVVAEGTPEEICQVSRSYTGQYLKPVIDRTIEIMKRHKMIEVNDKIRAKVEALPDSPGVYRWKDKDGRIIYVGKAKNLKNRVRSYVREDKNRSPKVAAMIRHADDLDITMTGSEMEALILECNLIKEMHLNIIFP